EQDQADDQRGAWLQEAGREEEEQAEDGVRQQHLARVDDLMESAEYAERHEPPRQDEPRSIRPAIGGVQEYREPDAEQQRENRQEPFVEAVPDDLWHQCEAEP